MTKTKTVYFNILIFFLLSLTSLTAQQRTAQKLDVEKAPVGAAPLWETRMNDTIRGMPHLQASSVVLAGEKGSVRSFFMSGTPLWDFNARGTAVPYIARSYEAASYVCNTDGVFMAINRVGRELWRLKLDRPITHSPVVGWDGRIYITINSIMTCRTASGHSLWTIDLGSPVAFTPILDRTGSAATVLQNMDFVKINQFSQIERIKLDRIPVLIVSLDEGDKKSYVLMYQSGEMEKIIFNEGAKNGSKLLKSSIKRLPGQPVAAASRDALFVVTLRDGKTLCLDSGGNVRWTKNSHEAAEEKGSGNISSEQTSMMFDERGIYTITIHGVSAFSHEGRRRFVHRLSAECSGIPALSDEGLLYACGRDNVLRVYKIDVKERTVPRIRFYGPEPEGTYGMGNPPPSPWTGQRSRYQDIEQDRTYEEISNIIKSGQIGENEPVYVAYMMEMVGFFIGNPHYSVVRPDVKPEQRIRLIRLLALVGSRETIPFFWNIFDLDPEPSVRRACADAIGVVGVDPTGRSFYSYHYLLTPNNPNTDPQLVLAATSSIAKLCRFSGPPLAPEGIRVLRYFSNLNTIPNVVKEQIRNELDGLFKEGLDKLIE
jgi:outer membrane protein assembly factor BamB